MRISHFQCRSKILVPSMEVDDGGGGDDIEGNGSQVDSRVERGELRDDDRALQNSYLRKVPSNISISDRSSNGRHSGERDSFLLPEFNELVKECNMSIATYEFSPKKTGEPLLPETESTKDYKCAEHDEHEQEIKRLRARVKTLEEREKNLEIQLLEYEGIKEHENTVTELKNQLRLNNVEAKLYNLKIESLLSNNKRLEARLADYTNVVTELEAARAKVKMLRKKLKSEGEQNREQILALQERVMRLKDEEKKAAEISQELEMVLMERKELKEELLEMRETNRSLKLENSDLRQKLDYVQMLATTALDNEEVLELREERRRLTKQNESLKKEIERHQAERSTDVEELVYLRWTNACLRHELTNHQPGPGNKTTPINTPSPVSDDKFKKHLTLDHAHNNNKANSVENTPDFDFDSQASCLTDIGERDDLATDTPSVNSKTESIHSSKPKVFAKLRKLLRGKGGNSRSSSAQGQNGQKPPPLERAVSVEDFASKLSCDFQFDNLRNSSGGSSTSRRSFDIQRSYSRGRKSVAWESSNCSSRTMDSLIEDDQDWSPGVQPPQDDDDAHNEAKTELLKYAETLKNCHSKKFPKRTALFG
ncbi:protein chup1 chloroplastic [Phtheirospermum japonicum]|uniref:Protein chup1 chloroplastic n=1 Tax=Phtheirospermum japonicum TaxID=374723 RepID=A0A830D7P6_9LAMI|nr:protein chup1 chloroplastic [Phtheirospermum japonicum]